MALTKPTGNIVDFSSSGVHIGGTGDANLLDDYEEGTWTPTVTTSSSVSVVSAAYSKIGRLVQVQFYIQWTNNQNNNSDQFRIGGLPFTALASSNFSAGSMGYVGAAVMSDALPLVQAANTYIYFHQNDGTTTTLVNSDSHSRNLANMIITLVYTAT
jgi:hypothetical protein